MAYSWVLIDPDGNTHKAVNLLDWARKNHLLFFDEDVPEDVAAKGSRKDSGRSPRRSVGLA